MFDLAPGHKAGLAVKNPILLAGGTIAYGDAVPPGLDISSLGGVVVGPIGLYGQSGSNPPRLGETAGGYVLNTGQQNRGVSSVVKRFGKLWSRLGCPVIAQVVERDVRDMARVVEQLCGIDGLVGIEILPARDATLDDACRLVDAAGKNSEAAVWVKLPMAQAALWTTDLVGAGAHGVVVGQPLQGALPSWGSWKSGWHDGTAADVESALVRGDLYGPLVYARMLEALMQVIELRPRCAVIACGGIYTRQQAEDALAAGADALQIDSAVWVEPTLPNWLVQELGFSGSPQEN